MCSCLLSQLAYGSTLLFRHVEKARPGNRKYRLLCAVVSEEHNIWEQVQGSLGGCKKKEPGNKPGSYLSFSFIRERRGSNPRSPA